MTSQPVTLATVSYPPEPGRIHRMLKGLLLGAIAGILFANAEVMAIPLFTYILWSVRVNPFTPAVASLYAQEVIQIALLGTLVATLGGRWLAARPYHFMGLLTALLLPLPFVLSTTAPLVVGGAALVALPLSCLGVWLSQRHTLRGWVGLALLLFGPFPLLALLPSNNSLPAEAGRPVPPEGAPNVLWVVFDTTRADHLSLYGYSRPTSPELDRLAADGAVFEQAYATTSWTAPSHASMLTGLYPRQHGCTFEHTSLAPDIPFLPQLLTEAGYDTALFAGNPWLDSHSGLNRGFLLTVPSWRSSFTSWFMLAGALRHTLALVEVDKGAANSNSELERWLSGRPQQAQARPFFAFVNYTEAHVPYFDIPEADREAFMPAGALTSEQKAVSLHLTNAEMQNRYAKDVLSPRDREIAIGLYDGGIRYEDQRLGELLALLKHQKLLDNTLVIVTADHGELLGEHDRYGHDQTLDHPLVRVPLVLRWPGQIPAGRRIQAPVQLTDLFATVLEAVGKGELLTAEARQRTLFPALKGEADPARPVFAELEPPLRSERLVKRLREVGIEPTTYRFASVQAENLRLIRGPGTAERLFDLSVDPGEEYNLLPEQEGQAQVMRALLAWFEQDHPPREKATTPAAAGQGLDAVSQERLKSLGYVQ